MPVVVALLLIVLAASVHGLRTRGAGPRWPFLLATVVSGGALACLVLATAVALVAGRDTWNAWVSGSAASESVTLRVLLVGGPVVLLSSGALVVVGLLLRSRHRVPPGPAAPR
jgi:hypothetical protein